MVKSEIRNCGRTLIEQQQGYLHYHQVRSIDMSISRVIAPRISQLIHVIGRVFCFENRKSCNLLLKLSCSHFFLFIFKSLVTANSGDSGILS